MKGSAYRFFYCKKLKLRSCLEDAKVGNMPELAVLISIRVCVGADPLGPVAACK